MEMVVPGICCLLSRKAVSDVRSVQSSSSLSCAEWDGGAVTESTLESVGDNNVLSGDVAYISGKLGDEIEVIELPW
jgi:hypothetical protein